MEDDGEDGNLSPLIKLFSRMRERENYFQKSNFGPKHRSRAKSEKYSIARTLVVLVERLAAAAGASRCDFVFERSRRGLHGRFEASRGFSTVFREAMLLLYWHVA